MSVYCQFYDNKQNKISEVIVSNASISIPANAVAGLFYDNTYKLDGLKLTLNNLTANDFSFDFAKDYFLYVFPSGYSLILATSVRSSSFMSGVPELSQNDIEYLKNLSDNSAIDFSTIVTALNSITSALSALTNLTNLSNLSNLADLANIITAIQNKDNQSDIVNKLDSIFLYKQANNTKRNVFTGTPLDRSIPDTNASNWSLMGALNLIRHCFLTENTAINNTNNINTKLVANLLALNGYGNDSTGQIPNNVSLNIKNSVFKQIRDKISNIETKLEQNLPFTTIVNNDYIDNCVSASVAYNKKIENIPFN